MPPSGCQGSQPCIFETYYNKSFACESFSQGMVGTINVNSDNAVWTSNEYKDLIRSSSDDEFQTQYLNFGMLL